MGKSLTAPMPPTCTVVPGCGRCSAPAFHLAVAVEMEGSICAIIAMPGAIQSGVHLIVQVTANCAAKCANCAMYKDRASAK